MELKAYTAVEETSGECAGNVFYAKSNVEARRMAADELNDGEFYGLRVNRAPNLDQYLGKPIPMSVMVWMGWWSECNTCGETINDMLYEDNEDYEDKEPVGVFNGGCFCCQECSDKWHKQKAEEPLIKHHEIQRLKALAEKYVRAPIFDEAAHCSVGWREEKPRIYGASIGFSVPNAEYSMRVESRDGKDYVHLPLPQYREPYKPHATKALDILFDSA